MENPGCTPSQRLYSFFVRKERPASKSGAWVVRWKAMCGHRVKGTNRDTWVMAVWGRSHGNPGAVCHSLTLAPKPSLLQTEWTSEIMVEGISKLAKFMRRGRQDKIPVAFVGWNGNIQLPLPERMNFFFFSPVTIWVVRILKRPDKSISYSLQETSQQ